MEAKDIENIRVQMRKGMLEYCVLLVLSRGAAYPPQIIEALSEAYLIVVEGTLYTLLNRLKREEKVSYSWQESPKGPPRKYYALSKLGFETLEVMSSTWDSIARTVAHFRDPDTAGLPMKF